MKRALIVLTAATAMSFGAVALAEETVEGPVMLSDTEMDGVVAGADAPPGWSGGGFPGATNGNNPFGFQQPPGWGPEGFPGGPKGGPNQ